MLFVFVFLYFMTFVLFLFLKMKYKKNENELRTVFFNIDLKRYCKDFFKNNNIKEIDCVEGNIYAFNIFQNKILIKKNDSMNLFYLFAITHELFHYHDATISKLYSFIYKLLSILFLVNKLLLTPFLIIVFFLSIFVKNISFIEISYTLPFFVFVTISVIRILFLPMLEIKASKGALNYIMSNVPEVNEPYTVLLSKTYRLAMTDQLLIAMYVFFLIMSMYLCIYQYIL